MKQARALLHVNWAHDRKLFGEGVGVAVIDTGLYSHPDFENRVAAFYDPLHGKEENYDDNGHGTHVAGIIGGNGQMGRGKYTGMAPGCCLIGVKVLDHKGNGNTPDVVEGIHWVIDHRREYNIRIINISVGTIPQAGSAEKSALVRGVDLAWDAGLVVVVAAGNNGPEPMSITTPGISRKVITVGSFDDGQIVDASGSVKTNYSGRGPTQYCICKPDVVACGSNIISCNAMNRRPARPYSVKSGTSMSTPIVAGAIALLLGVYPGMSNAEVKMRLKNRAMDMGLPKNRQGWGMLDVQNLLR